MTSIPNTTCRALVAALATLALGAGPAAADHSGDYRGTTTDTYLLPDKRMDVYASLHNATWDNKARARVVATTTEAGNQGQACVRIEDPAQKLVEEGCGPVVVKVPDYAVWGGIYGHVPSTYTIGGRKPRSGRGTIWLSYTAYNVKSEPVEWTCYWGYFRACPEPDPVNRLLWGSAQLSDDSNLFSTTGVRSTGGQAYVEVSTPKP